MPSAGRSGSAITAQLTWGTYSRVPITSRFQKLVYSNGALACSRSFFMVGGGSGFFIKPGEVVTNMHVIRGAHRVEIHTLEGKGRTYPVAGALARTWKSDQCAGMFGLAV